MNYETPASVTLRAEPEAIQAVSSGYVWIASRSLCRATAKCSQ
ncbi:MAG: hypothetical protein AAB767_00730 [Patescibacteria group bacterium]